MLLDLARSRPRGAEGTPPSSFIIIPIRLLPCANVDVLIFIVIYPQHQSLPFRFSDYYSIFNSIVLTAE